MTSREALLRGGESGEAAVVPGRYILGHCLGPFDWDDLEMPLRRVSDFLGRDCTR